MSKYYWIFFVVLGAIISFFISKKQRNKNNELTRRGFYQLITLFVVMFVGTILLAVFTNN